jgi:hypothetical protein
MTMATDLPSRPPHDPNEQQSIIDPKERVKSAADKPDPRFEAARQKAAREEKVRAERAAKARAQEDADADTDDGETGTVTLPSGSFSFNMTADSGDDEASGTETTDQEGGS